ncbi:MAG: hypothetical protein HYY44_04905 [Deltaproteobacteria bacterium]|nr:hypothetical protein [Deltaproteobacteria bacterium]MBI4373422.1 hypothetical protein [Deltaproteobacteria bacterium]
MQINAWHHFVVQAALRSRKLEKTWKIYSKEYQEVNFQILRIKRTRNRFKREDDGRATIKEVMYERVPNQLCRADAGKTTVFG